MTEAGWWLLVELEMEYWFLLNKVNSPLHVVFWVSLSATLILTLRLVFQSHLVLWVSMRLTLRTNFAFCFLHYFLFFLKILKVHQCNQSHFWSRASERSYNSLLVVVVVSDLPKFLVFFSTFIILNMFRHAQTCLDMFRHANRC